jgi:2-octaprenyl-3-methyl-6-methoxy-1,4-benzoquinol hydroxylase/2-octaprenylphenol hydroxylase
VLREARGRGGDIGATHVLRRYERERRSESMLAARGLDAIERVYASAGTPLAVLRGAALACAGGLAPLRHALASIAAGR